MDTRHRIDCEYWHDQYPWECSCGTTPRMTYLEWVELRRKEWLKRGDGERQAAAGLDAGETK